MLNQLGRRNLSKEDRDEMIRRLASSGKHTQKEIAQAVGLTKMRINQIVNEGGSKETLQVPSITNPDLTVTAKLKDELDSLRKRLKDEEIVSGIEAIPEKPDEPPITIRFSVDEMAYFLNTKKRSRVRS